MLPYYICVNKRLCTCGTCTHSQPHRWIGEGNPLGEHACDTDDGEPCTMACTPCDKNGKVLDAVVS